MLNFFLNCAHNLPLSQPEPFAIRFHHGWHNYRCGLGYRHAEQGGAKSAIQAQVASMGTNMILILPGAPGVGGVRGGFGSIVTLIVNDARDLQKKVPTLHETGWSKQ